MYEQSSPLINIFVRKKNTKMPVEVKSKNLSSDCSFHVSMSLKNSFFFDVSAEKSRRVAKEVQTGSNSAENVAAKCRREKRERSQIFLWNFCVPWFACFQSRVHDLHDSEKNV